MATSVTTVFRARARALDMLGRQQIAGIPTAISELFKNAHDAYAREVRADFIRTDEALVLRDDGQGMTRGEFLDRWLTLGTESKLTDPIARRTDAPDAPPRPVLGEKGIGRLAMAVIGPQVLVVSKGTLQDGTPSEYTAAFISWRLFEFPGINLDDVPIPVETGRGAFPTASALRALVEQAAEDARRLPLGPAKDAVVDGIKAFPLNVIDRVLSLPGPKLTDDQTGTFFLISPVDRTLAADLREQGDEPSRIVKLLIGFTNPLTSPVDFRARFWDRREDGAALELIGPSQFWEEGDFVDADHEIVGSFDEYGTFHGTVRVFHERVEHTISRPGEAGLLACGPFGIRFAVMQGANRESPLPPDRWSFLIRKAERIGGLYIYRNGIRVLPYGDNEYDYLDIEKNRSKSAGYYFFSYRRMFGYISLDTEVNRALSEKAGREGFRDNFAYREFQALLKHFFVQLAADFFRPKGVQSSLFLERRDELSRAERARREHARRAAEDRKFVSELLSDTFERLSRQRPEPLLEKITTEAAEDLAGLPRDASPEDVLARVTAGRTAVMSAVQPFRVALPAGTGLPEDLRRDWEALELERNRIETAATAALERIDQVAAAALEERAQSATAVAQRELEIASEGAQAATRERAEELERSAAELRERIRLLINQLLQSLDSAFSTAVAAVGETDQNDGASTSLAIRGKWLGTIDDIRRRNEELLSGLAAQINGVGVIRAPDGVMISSQDVTGAAEQELLALREQVDRDLELAQLGMAVEVVSHEFNATIRSIRSGLIALDRWATRNPALGRVNQELATSFQHLDSYLSLFTPLQRRAQDSDTELSGGEIYRFLKRLFHDRLAQNHIELEATDRYRAHLFQGRPSVVYPVLVNLIDNAIFWVADAKPPRVIRLGTDGRFLTVEDSGPGIPIRDRSAIFEPGFTRKPSGRGLGLYISREVLERQGFRLSVDKSDSLGGARFEIGRVATDE